VALRNRRLASLALFAALTIAHTWPLAGDPGRWSRLDNDDAALYTWVISWVAHQAVRAPLDLFNAPIFHPEQRTLAYSEHMLVPSLMGAPLLWAGASPVLVHNLLFMLGMTLSGWVMCMVVARWTGSWSAGLVAGLLYGFNAHVLARFTHLQAQHVEFLPLMLYAMDRVLAGGTRRHVALLASAFVLQALCSNYLLVFAAFTLVAAAAVRPGEWLGAGRGPVARHLGVAAVASVALVAPFLWPYYVVSRDQGLARSIEEVARYSADWRDYLTTGGRLHYAWWSHRFFEGRTALFPGAAGLALAAVALGSGVAIRDRRARMLLAAGVMGVALSLGPALPGYAWLHAHVPLLSGLRGAARWGWLALTAVAVLAGFGVAVLEGRWGRSRMWPWAVAALAVVITAEALRAPVGFTEFHGIPRIYDRLAAEPSVVLAEFPFYWGPRFAENGPYLVNNTRYLRPLVNGYSGFQPAAYEARGQRLSSFPGESAMAELQALGVTHVTVHVAPFRDRTGDEALAAIGASPLLELVAEEDGIRLYRMRRP
jgi:hypothetical protein